nr:EOG090X06AF [Cyclestheria hislopi]
MERELDPSIVEYFPDHSGHKCGYCKQKTSSFSHGMWAHTMSVEDYQDLIDRGWRRSGCYCYKPIMKKTCCPQYTIRCLATEFKLNHSHKKILKKVNKFLTKGLIKGELQQREPCKQQPEEQGGFVDTKVALKLDKKDAVVEHIFDVCGNPKPPQKKAKLKRLEQRELKLAGKDIVLQKKPKSIVKSLEDFLGEKSGDACVHHLEVKMVKPGSKEFQSTFTESYKLYVKYQVTVHHDKEEKCTEEQYERFLVNSPLEFRQLDHGPPMGYGSFHQQYWLDNQLIAVAVIDILPKCLSSVYFYYDPDYSYLSLGTYGSLREMALVRELSQYCPELCWYYLGFYIHSCPKMRYKGQYNPSYLLCPEAFTWIPIGSCIPKLDQSKYSRLEEDNNVVDTDRIVDLSTVGVLYKRQAMTFSIYRRLKQHHVDEEKVKEYASLVGMKCARRILLYRS